MILSNGLYPVIRVPVVDDINERLKDYNTVCDSHRSIHSDPEKLALAKQNYIDKSKAARNLGWSDKTDEQIERDAFKLFLPD